MINRFIIVVCAVTALVSAAVLVDRIDQIEEWQTTHDIRTEKIEEWQTIHNLNWKDIENAQ